jgi:hypothetical protein
MNRTQIETVGKVFVVVGSMRRCLICDGMFTPRQSAEHAGTACFSKKQQGSEISTDKWGIHPRLDHR